MAKKRLALISKFEVKNIKSLHIFTTNFSSTYKPTQKPPEYRLLRLINSNFDSESPWFV